MLARIAAVLKERELQSDFLRETIIMEVERRERAKKGAKERSR